MKSEPLVKNTSPKVIGITPDGIFLRAYGDEYFLKYDRYPWFKGRPVNQVLNVEDFGDGDLNWPDLDVDLSIDGIINPEKYPLIARDFR